MTWLDSLASWLGDPANISSIAPSVIVILCTIALIITVAVSARRLGTRLERAIANETPVRRVPTENRQDRRDRAARSERSEPVTGPLRTGTTPSATPSAAPNAAPLTSTVAPAVAPPPAVGTVAPPLPPSMMTPPPSAQAFARASALNNDPLNQ